MFAVYSSKSKRANVPKPPVAGHCFFDKVRNVDSYLGRIRACRGDIGHLVSVDHTVKNHEIMDITDIMERDALSKVVPTLSSISFSLYKEKEILDMSKTEVTISRQTIKGLTSNNVSELSQTVFDPLMGVISDDMVCGTCNKTQKDCVGHFGHIDLKRYVVHPFPVHRKVVKNVLRLTCLRCCSYLGEQSCVNPLKLGEVKRVNSCPRCEDPVSLYTTSIVNASTVNSNIGVICACSSKKKAGNKKVYWWNTIDNINGNENFLVPMDSEFIRSILDKISDDDSARMGFKKNHPRDYCFRYLLVAPPCVRPVSVSLGGIHDDPLSGMYCTIIGKVQDIENPPLDRKRKKKLNVKPFAFVDAPRGVDIHDDILDLENAIYGLYNGTTSTGPSNSMVKKGFKERLSGKTGVFRGQLLGKRSEGNARTVVGGAPENDADQVSIPEIIAKHLTVPVGVTKENIDVLQEIVNRGYYEKIRTVEIRDIKSPEPRVVIKSNPVKIKDCRYNINPGDVVYRNGKEVSVTDRYSLEVGDEIVTLEGEVTKVTPITFRYPTLKYGDEVWRYLVDDDPIIVNRQPTLHTGSMIGARAKIDPNRRTIGIPLNMTTPMNCDFDGDEVNIHVPRSVLAKVEVKDLMHVKHNTLSYQSSRPMVGLVQDSLIGGYILTGVQEVKDFDDICKEARVPSDRVKKVKEHYKDRPVDGLGLLSLALPNNLTYRRHNLEIEKGILKKCVFNKSYAGAKQNAIHHIITNKDDIMAFFTINQKVISRYLFRHCYTVGIKDCVPQSYDQHGVIPEIMERINQRVVEIRAKENSFVNEVKKEIATNSALNALRSECEVITKNSLVNNNFISMIESGSKGSYSNIVQITGILGQQNVGSSRIPNSCIGDRVRSLPFFRDYDEEENPLVRYASRGFIVHSFAGGLSPVDFWCHATCGRDGMISTAVGTAVVGYDYRKMSECVGNIVVSQSNEVVDAAGRIVMTSYGTDTLDPRYDSPTILDPTKTGIDVFKILQNSRGIIFPRDNFKIQDLQEDLSDGDDSDNDEREEWDE